MCYRSILVENSTVDKIQNNGFSGFLMNNITLRGVAINRIERSAFADQSAIDFLHIDRCNIREDAVTTSQDFVKELPWQSLNVSIFFKSLPDLILPFKGMYPQVCTYPLALWYLETCEGVGDLGY
jgi:hypothetical protein